MESKQRQITIYGTNDPVRKPKIMLQGNWLHDMGFNVGDLISITGENGEITIKKIGTYQDKKINKK